jgi:hypothetical protein
MFAFCVGVAMSHVPRSLDKGRRCCEYGGRVQKLELWDCAFGWYHGYHIYYSGRPLKFSDLGYSPGQPLPIFTGAYSAQIPEIVYGGHVRDQKRSLITFEPDFRTGNTTKFPYTNDHIKPRIGPEDSSLACLNTANHTPETVLKHHVPLAALIMLVLTIGCVHPWSLTSTECSPLFTQPTMPRPDREARTYSVPWAMSTSCSQWVRRREPTPRCWWEGDVTSVWEMIRLD